MTNAIHVPVVVDDETSEQTLSTQQIGRLGELLVQFRLLQAGIDSAPMTVDAGIDLVAYSVPKARSVTIQVKTNLAPKPGGGKGSPAIDWWVSEDCPAELYALVELSARRIWLFTKVELASTAQQHSNGRLHFYMYTDAGRESRAYTRHGDVKFSDFLLENRMSLLFR
jgi:hypothetical protein